MKKVDFLDFNNTVDRMKDGQLDAGFVVAGWPAAAIMDLATTHDVDLVSFDDEFLAKLQKKYPFFVKDVVPAGTYRGIDHDVVAPAVMAMIVVDADVPEEVVYQFTKAMWDHIDEVQRTHAKAQLITLETAFDGLPVPLHDGAARYYKEIGLKSLKSNSVKLLDFSSNQNLNNHNQGNKGKASRFPLLIVLPKAI